MGVRRGRLGRPAPAAAQRDLQGGPDPEPTFAAHPVAAAADPAAVTATLAAFAGFLLDGARLPPPPGLPTLRAFQLGQGVVALDWLRLRTGWA